MTHKSAQANEMMLGLLSGAFFNETCKQDCLKKTITFLWWYAVVCQVKHQRRRQSLLHLSVYRCTLKLFRYFSLSIDRKYCTSGKEEAIFHDNNNNASCHKANTVKAFFRNCIATQWHDKQTDQISIWLKLRKKKRFMAKLYSAMLSCQLLFKKLKLDSDQGGATMH